MFPWILYLPLRKLPGIGLKQTKLHPWKIEKVNFISQCKKPLWNEIIENHLSKLKYYKTGNCQYFFRIHPKFWKGVKKDGKVEYNFSYDQKKNTFEWFLFLHFSILTICAPNLTLFYFSCCSFWSWHPDIHWFRNCHACYNGEKLCGKHSHSSSHPSSSVHIFTNALLVRKLTSHRRKIRTFCQIWIYAPGSNKSMPVD